MNSNTVILSKLIFNDSKWRGGKKNQPKTNIFKNSKIKICREKKTRAAKKFMLDFMFIKIK